jgi:hypothetical protein
MRLEPSLRPLRRSQDSSGGARPPVAALLLLLLSVLLAPSPLRAQQQPAPAAAAPAGFPAPPEEPVFTGSFSPGVVLEDISYTIRMNYMRTITISPHDPNVAYAGGYDGYVWKTIDGGRTWDESRLITEIFPYFGDANERIYFGVHRSGGGSSGQSYTEARSGESKQIAQQSTWSSALPSSSSSGSGGGGGNTNFGIGVPGGAPRLQVLVRKMGKITSGQNIKQTLMMRGARPGEVRMIVVHPRKPDIVFACTAFGLYRSVDGGRNWVRTFTGTSPRGRFAVHVVIDPKDDRKVLLATGEGLYISKDGGDNFMKSTAGGVGDTWTSWLQFYPYDSRYVFAVGDAGVLRSADGGKSWSWIYYTTFPQARTVVYLTIDPFEKKRGYIATYDGLFTTDNLLEGGLENWRRVGGLKFTGINMIKVDACPRHKGHLWTATIMRLPSPTISGTVDTGGAYILESLDGGENWKVIYAGNTNGSFQWYDNDLTDPDLLWIAWSRSLSRMRRVRASNVDLAHIKLPDDPTIGDVLTAAQRFTGVDPGVQLEYRHRSLYKALVPKVTAQFAYYRWRDFDLQKDGLYSMIPYRFQSSYADSVKEFRFFATWDLSGLVFQLDSVLFGRIERLTEEHRQIVRFEAHRFYSELKRLRVLMAVAPPKDLRVRLMYRARIEELTAYIDFITGGYLTRWRRGDHPKAEETKWWEQWPR